MTFVPPRADRIDDIRVARRSRVAVTAIFIVHALLFASWTAHIPEIKERLGLTDAALGTALLGAPVGSVLAMIVTGWLLPRLGSKRVIQVALIGYSIAGLAVGCADSLLGLFVTLAAWGVFQGSLDVAMNTQGVIIERSIGRPIMSGLHGAWSIGALVGAFIGAAAVGLGLALGPQLLILGVSALTAVGWLTFSLLPDHTGLPETLPDRKTRRLPILSGPTLILGGIAFMCMLCEGATADWSAEYLHNDLHASPSFAGLGYVAFALAMVVVRLSGNRILRRFRARTALPALAIVSTVGLTVALLAQNPIVALVGFASLGLGLAAVVPTAFSAAARHSDGAPSTSIAIVSAFGWAGFVCGPPAIGHLAGAVGLPIALIVLPLLTLAIAVIVRATTSFEYTTIEA